MGIKGRALLQPFQNLERSKTSKILGLTNHHVSVDGLTRDHGSHHVEDRVVVIQRFLITNQNRILKARNLPSRINNLNQVTTNLLVKVLQRNLVIKRNHLHGSSLNQNGTLGALDRHGVFLPVVAVFRCSDSIRLL